MKALSIHPAYAIAIAAGEKTIEVRTWETKYRGDIVICSTAKKASGTIPSHSLCIVELVDIVPLKKEHLKDALIDRMPDVDCYAWKLDNVRLIKPEPVKGKLGLWEYSQPVEYLPIAQTEEEDQALYDKYYKPLII